MCGFFYVCSTVCCLLSVCFLLLLSGADDDGDLFGGSTIELLPPPSSSKLVQQWFHQWPKSILCPLFSPLRSVVPVHWRDNRFIRSLRLFWLIDRRVLFFISFRKPPSFTHFLLVHTHETSPRNAIRPPPTFHCSTNARLFVLPKHSIIAQYTGYTFF